jgi:RimJ/RimL family protein N-acetyltransferase
VREGVAELGFRLRRDAWGQGYASEGARALVTKGFADLRLERVVATTMSVNLASRHVLEKAGLAYARTVHARWAEPLPGSEMGDVEYEITHDVWEATTLTPLSVPGRSATPETAKRPSDC